MASLDIEKIIPFSIYKGTSLTRLKEGKERFLGCYLNIFSSKEDFVLRLSNMDSGIKFIIRDMKIYYIERNVNLLSIFPKSQFIVPQDDHYKLVKGNPSTKFFSTFPSQIEKIKGRSNFVQNSFSELTKFFGWVAPDRTKAKALYELINHFFDRLLDIPFDYDKKIFILDGEDPEVIKILDLLVTVKNILKIDFRQDLKILIVGKNWLSKFDVNEINLGKKEKLIETIKKIQKLGESSLSDKEVLIVPDSPELKKLDAFKSEVINNVLLSIGEIPDKEVLLTNSIEMEVEKIVMEEYGASGKIPNSEEILERVLKSEVLIQEVRQLQIVQKEKTVLEEKRKILREKEKETNVTFENSLSKETIKLFDLTGKNVPDKIDFFTIKDKSIGFEEMKISKIRSLNQGYKEKLMRYDSMKVISSLSEDESIPLFIDNIEIKDTSDEFNKQETFNLRYKDSKGGSHTINIDVPKMTNGGYLYLNGSKKFIGKQLFPMPIIKKKPDEVQITTWYNKAFANRRGTKASAPIEKLRKTLIAGSSKLVKATLGNAHKKNKLFTVPFIFDELSKDFLKIETKNYTFNFDISEVEGILKAKNESVMKEFFKNYPDTIPIALRKDLSSFFFIQNDFLYEASMKKYEVSQIQPMNDLMDFILLVIKEEDPNLYSEISNASVGKSFAHSIVRIIGRSIPIVILLGFKDGLTKVLSRYGIKYEFVPSNKRITDEVAKLNYASIDFSDGKLIYDASKFRNSLLVSGLNSMDTKEYEFKAFNTDAPYLDFFEVQYNSRNVAKGFRNFWERLIDHATKEVLEQLKQPTDFSGVMLYVNTLLEDNTFIPISDVSKYRVRSAEMINHALYQELSDAFVRFKVESVASGTMKKLSIKQDGLKKRLIESPNVESISLLSPVVELEALDKCTFKGLGGTNLDDALTYDYRIYNENMKGTFGYSTPFSSQAGIVKTLSSNCDIKNLRGFINTTEKDKNSSEMLSMTELLLPFTVAHSDFQRIGMATIQAKHVTPSNKNSRPLVGSGAHKSLAHIIGNDFVFKAAKKGSIREIDEKNECIILDYEDGSNGIIDLKPKLNKNVKAGFYLETSYEHKLKKGQKFAEGEILAYDPGFFKPSLPFAGGKDSLEFTFGVMTRVAMATDSDTFEDASIITRKVTKDLSFPVVLDKFISLGPNANIIKMVKKGDHVKASDPLIVFESSFDEADVNEVLARLGSEFGEKLLEAGHNVIPAKMSGEIVDIRIFFNREESEMSPSIKKLISSYKKENSSRSEILKKSRTEDIIQIDTTEKIEYQKLYGKDFDGVLIQFFIKHEDESISGSKLSFQVALKSITGSIVDDEEAPYSMHDGKKINAVFSPLSEISRMTTDVYNAMYTNKLIVGLKEKSYEIWKNRKK
jgi:hypothetical protein